MKAQQNQLEQSLQKPKKSFKIYEDLLLEIRSEFFSYLIKRFTSDFQFLNIEHFQLDKILELYWEIGLSKNNQKELMKILQKKLMLKSILDQGQFNLKLFTSDYVFISECITTQITNEIKNNNQSFKISANFYVIKFFRLDEFGEFQRIGLSINAQSCHSLIPQLEEQLQKVIKKWKQIKIIIFSVSKFNKECIKAISNQIFNLYSNFELKFYFFEESKKDQSQQDGQQQTLISEQQLILLENDFFQHRYELHNQDYFQPFKQLSENLDQELMRFECKIHNEKIRNL
ncbi:unnamed protein product [Paramecium octaurelia]|uniref:Uncharacterized protein n=1 Tax=Paramecium octaurelia TaxID=43137 RepID=A0A8S1VGA3_PAROT|nr:unnamed protein product [Paramecium octaurelia]